MSMNEALYIIYTTLTSIDAETLDPYFCKSHYNYIKSS